MDGLGTPLGHGLLNMPTKRIYDLCKQEKIHLQLALAQCNQTDHSWILLRRAKPLQKDEYGFHLVRGLGGHGYGKTLHAPPFISNVVPSHPSEWPDAWRLFESGMLMAVEPMLAVSTGQILNRTRHMANLHCRSLDERAL